MTKKPWYARGVARLVVAGVVGATGVTMASGAAEAQALPSPFSYVSNLDLECFKTNSQTPNVGVQLKHLNPVLQNLPVHKVVMGAREQLCVPVTKNNVIPPSPALDYIRFTDLSCYKITAAPVNFPVTLKHLNPVLQQMGLPPENVTMTQAQQLCVPVAKNNVVLPPAVKRVVQYIDLECFGITPQVPINVPLSIGQLNPVLQPVIPGGNVTVTSNRQLCVPVAKNNQQIPADVLALVKWIDLKKYDVVTAPLPNPVTLQLHHLNPLFTTLPVETATLTAAVQLGVPVSKNGVVPPTAGIVAGAAVTGEE